jgi:hypothetical protein
VSASHTFTVLSKPKLPLTMRLPSPLIATPQGEGRADSQASVGSAVVEQGLFALGHISMPFAPPVSRRTAPPYRDRTTRLHEHAVIHAGPPFLATEEELNPESSRERLLRGHGGVGLSISRRIPVPFPRSARSGRWTSRRSRPQLSRMPSRPRMPMCSGRVHQRCRPDCQGRPLRACGTTHCLCRR